MQIENSFNLEKLSDTAQKLLNTIREANKTEILGIVACAVTAQYVINTFLLDRLRAIPGPFAAKLSRFYDVKLKASGKAWLLIDELHNKYGKVVRTGKILYSIRENSVRTAHLNMLGYNTVSIRDPDAVKQIYGNERFRKSSFYEAFIFHVRKNHPSTRLMLIR
jgi:hypothetical protein